ncbi:hypothetical protein [Lewinella sp. IMCC34183]|uniref:hypothetical protein n=1 Tax=Lewinella sp. IMCC34183 TaxID=2248762 RepID=UPI000E265BE5|nr:hypothetical protein [Lewinella sp. IMCC34183]
MKTVLITLLCCLSAPAWAQQTYTLAAGGKTIEFREIDNLKIVGATGNQMTVEGDRVGGDSDDRANGLRKISASGLKDNTGFGLSVTESGGRILVEQVGSGDREVTVNVPNSATVKVEQSTHRGGDLTVTDFGGSLDVSMMYHKATLNNVTGAVAVSTVYDDIIAIWDSAPTQEVRLHSTYSDVDVTLPASAKADLRLSTAYGEMYTDFDIQMKPNMVEATPAETSDRRSEWRAARAELRESRGSNGQTLAGTIGGGGPLLALTATYDNLYLRKK